MKFGTASLATVTIENDLRRVRVITVVGKDVASIADTDEHKRVFFNIDLVVVIQKMQKSV